MKTTALTPYSHLPAFFLIGFLLLSACFHTPLLAQTPKAKFTPLDLDHGMSLINVRTSQQDSLGIIWLASPEGLFRYDGTSYTHYHSNNREHYIPTTAVHSVTLGRRTNEVIFHKGLQVFKLDADQNRCTEIKFEMPDSKPLTKPDLSLLLDKKGILWMVVKERKPNPRRFELHLFKSTDFKNFKYLDSFTSNFLQPKKSYRSSNFYSESKRGIYLSLNQSIVELDTNGKIINTYPFPNDDPGAHFVDEDGTLWVINLLEFKGRRDKSDGKIYYLEENANALVELPLKTPQLLEYARFLHVEKDKIIAYGGGLVIIDRNTLEGTSFVDDLRLLNKNYFTSYPSIKSVYKDPLGVYWLGGGRLVLMEIEAPVSHYLQDGSEFCNAQNCPIRGITEDEAGNIYFASARNLLRLDPKTDSIQSIQQIYGRKFKIWEPWELAFYNNELYVDNYKLNLQTGEQTIVAGKRRGQVYHVQDNEGNIWFGLYRPDMKIYKPNDKSVVDHQALPDSLKDSDFLLNEFFPQRNGSGLWIVTQSDGLFLIDRQKGILEQYTYDSKNENSLLSRDLYCAEEDQQGNLWIGSSFGLSYLDRSSNTFTHYRTSDGLPGSKIFSMILMPGEGLWMGTNNGLSYFDIAEKNFSNFSTQDGLGNTEYNRIAAFKSKSGKLYFGGLNGIDAFYPDDLLHPDISSSVPILLTEYNRFDGNQNQKETKGLEKLNTIQLPPTNQYFDLQFRLADYRPLSNTLYQYKLEGYDKDWSTVSSYNSLRYENLPPGDYKLRIKASISPTVWNEQELTLNVIKEQFWYKTKLAYALWFLLAAALIYALYRYQLNRNLERAEARRLKELDSLKTKLYTNITHEFRTPLTVIKGMADTMEGDPEAKQLIRRNSKNLLHLVTQLLDMSKLESGKMELKTIRRDVISYLAYLTASFKSYAETKRIELKFESEIPELVMDYDPEKLQHVIANLISNAIKFTHESGQIKVHVSHSPALLDLKHNPLIKISIQDNGIGISQEHLPHIFDRFYQIDDTHTRRAAGTGIGLALTKELVKVMGGSISVKSAFAKGTEFIVLVPALQFAKTNGQSTEEPIYDEYLSPIEQVAAVSTDVFIQPPVSEEELQDAKLPLLLLIEDNADIVSYIKICLKHHYNIQVAYDGQAGIEKALEIIPDIIISDVMMPVKDGFEVTQFLKNDERTSHIPIIILTAKVDIESKLAGLTRGADAYLAKPFHKEELLIRLQKMIDLRKRLQARYNSVAAPPPSEDVAIQVEDAFLKKVRDVIEDNLGDAVFSVAELCRQIGLSQPQLYRKVKAVTGKSIVAYIRSIRLQRGKELLESSDLTVSEVAYDVGFTDPSYFSKTFSKAFGYPPKERFKE